jgi:hypothetical protein
MVQWLWLVISKWPHRAGVFLLSLEDGNSFRFRNVVSSSIYKSGRWTKSRNPVILSVMHHRQKHLDSIHNQCRVSPRSNVFLEQKPSIGKGLMCSYNSDKCIDEPYNWIPIRITVLNLWDWDVLSQVLQPTRILNFSFPRVYPFGYDGLQQTIYVSCLLLQVDFLYLVIGWRTDVTIWSTPKSSQIVVHVVYILTLTWL